MSSKRCLDNVPTTIKTWSLLRYLHEEGFWTLLFLSGHTPPNVDMNVFRGRYDEAPTTIDLAPSVMVPSYVSSHCLVET